MSAVAGLPEGVVTFLFTDIEGSTRLLQSAGDGYAALLEEHNRIVRAALTEHAGHEVATTGDGFFIAFSSPVQAVAAAAEAQRRLDASPPLAEHGLRVRMGLHSGEAQITHDNYVGLAVHHASRVANAGHGGQVLVSEPARSMAGDADEFGFHDLGQHLLKDVGRPLRLFQLTGEGLLSDFPPLRSLNGGFADLPLARTSFVGREADLKLLMRSLSEPGLVTLTGPGGTGKTRLAVEVARRMRTSFEGTWFVDLQAVVEPDEVAAAAAAALQVADAGQPEGLIDRLVERCAGGACLVVLDNCEHLVAACAELTATLLARCPELRVLATSRDLLGIAAERPQRVPPLDEASAAQLFVDRAQRLVPGFDPAGDEPALAAICKRLDGIPLAIELAAARVRHMPLVDLAARLSDIFLLLLGTRGRGLQRHQTLEAVVDWSHDLLDPAERAVLRRLSVLPGGFELAAAEAVGRGDPVDGSVADVVFRLVDASLVDHDGRGRYTQLETLRAYGQIKLRDTGETEAVRDRQVEHFVSVAEGAAEQMRHGAFFEGLDVLDREADNLYAAVEWATGRDHSLALRLIAATAHFATITGRNSFLVLAARSVSDPVGPPDLRAAACVEMAVAATVFGWHELACHGHDAMNLLGPETTEPDERDQLRARCLASLALAGASADQMTEIKSVAARAKSLAHRCGLPDIADAAEAAEGWQLMRSGEIAGGCRVLGEVAERSRAARPTLWSATALFWAGLAAVRAGAWPGATAYLRAALPLFQRVSYKLYVQWTLDGLSFAALHEGNLAAARAYAEEGVTLSLESGLGAGTNLAYLYERLGYLEWQRRDYPQSARYYQDALEQISTRHSAHDHAALRANLAAALVRAGDLAEARPHLAAAIDLTETLEPVEGTTGAVAEPPVANVVQALAHLALAVGLADEAAEMAGVLVRLHQPASVAPAARDGLARFQSKVQAALQDDIRFKSALERGAALERPLQRAREILESTVEN